MKDTVTGVVGVGVEKKGDVFLSLLCVCEIEIVGLKILRGRKLAGGSAQSTVRTPQRDETT